MNSFPYEDIINLPHQKSKSRKPMPLSNRAAQFAPFAALTGYDEAVKETARITEERLELDEYQKEELNRKMLYLQEHLEDELTVTITYFLPDERKSGGKYYSISGIIKKIKSYENVIVMNDNTEIPIQEIILIESEVFNLIDEY